MTASTRDVGTTSGAGRELSRRSRVALLAAIVGIGVALRLALVPHRSIWFDEAFCWRIASFPVGELLQRVAADNNPPLYFLLLKVWIACFGDSLSAMRGLSVLLGGTTIVGVYLFCMEAFRSSRVWCGLLAAAFVALACAQVRWSAEVRMYALGTALCALSSWALLRATRREAALGGWLLYALLALAFLYTHYFAIFSLAAHAMFVATLLVWLGPSQEAGWQSRRALSRNGFLTALFLVAGFLPWLPQFLKQQRQVAEQFWTADLDLWSVPTAINHLFAEPPLYERPGPAPDAALALAVTACCLLAVASCLYRPTPQDWFVFLSAAVPVVLSLVLAWHGTAVFFYRYLLFAQLFVLVAAARAISRLPGPARPVAAVAALANLTVLAAASWSAADLPNRPGMRSAIQYIQRQRSADELVLTCSPMYYLPALYHAGGGVPVALSVSDPEGIPHYEGAAALRPADFVNPAELAADRQTRVWTVGGVGCAPPGEWDLVASGEFPEGSIYGATVVVQEYERPGQ